MSKEIDWSKIPEDTTHVRVESNNIYCYYKDITEDGSYQYKYPDDYGWNLGQDFPFGWHSGALIARPMVTNDAPLVTSLLNTKIDLRKEDGTIDIELSKAFQEAVTGGDESKYSGWAAYYDIKEHYTQNAYFIFVDKSGGLSLADENNETYFNSHRYKQINFTYTRKLEWEATEVVKSPPKVDLVDGNAYMFDFKERKGLIGILHSEVKYGSLHRMLCTTQQNSKYNSEFCTNIKRLVPEEV